MIGLFTVINWSFIVNLPAVSSASRRVTSSALTFIVAPEARVIFVVERPFMKSNLSITVSSKVASTEVSETAIVVKPELLLNSFPLMAV